MQSTIVTLRSSNERAADSMIFVGDLNAPNKAQKLYRDGVSEIKRQRWRDAERLLEKSLSVYPEFAAAYNALGVAATEDGEFTVADSAFRRAIRIRPNYSEAYLNFAISLDRQKKFSESEVQLNNLLTFEEENRVAITALAKVLFEQQKFEDVVNLAHEVHLKQRAHDPALHRYAFEVYSLRGMKPESAKEAALVAVESRNHR